MEAVKEMQNAILADLQLKLKSSNIASQPGLRERASSSSVILAADVTQLLDLADEVSAAEWVSAMGAEWWMEARCHYCTFNYVGERKARTLQHVEEVDALRGEHEALARAVLGKRSVCRPLSERSIANQVGVEVGPRMCSVQLVVHHGIVASSGH